MAEKYYRLGCDIGGTFTDFVLLNDQTGELTINKCLTTPKDPSDAVEQGIRELEVKVPGFVEKMDEVIHGTTLVINSIIERKGARTGLITTKGFRDVLELGREIRYAPYDIFSEYPKPLVPASVPSRSGRKDPQRRNHLETPGPGRSEAGGACPREHGGGVDCGLPPQLF